MLRLWIRQQLGGNVQPEFNAAERSDPFPRGSRSAATATRRLESYYAPRHADAFTLPPNDTSDLLQHFLDPPPRDLDVLLVNINSDELPSEHERGSGNIPSADKRVEHHSALLRKTFDHLR